MSLRSGLHYSASEEAVVVQVEQEHARTSFTPILWSSCLAVFAVGANSTAIMAALPSSSQCWALPYHDFGPDRDA